MIVPPRMKQQQQQLADTLCSCAQNIQKQDKKQDKKRQNYPTTTPSICVHTRKDLPNRQKDMRVVVREMQDRWLVCGHTSIYALCATETEIFAQSHTHLHSLLITPKKKSKKTSHGHETEKNT